MHRADPQAIGDHFGPNARGAVIDHEIITNAVERMLEHRVFIPPGKRLLGNCLVMENDDKFAKCLEAVGQGRVALARRFERIGLSRE